MRRFRIREVLAVLAVTTFVVAQVPTDDNPWKSETFLSDYSRLQLVPSKRGEEWLYVAPGAHEKIGKYDAFMVDQPEISLAKDSPYHSAKPDDLKAIAEFVRSALNRNLEAQGLKIVDQKGENVCYLRLAMTDLYLKKKTRGVLAYTPVGAVVHGVKSAVQNVMKNVDIIDMAAQAEFSDSLSGEVLGAMAGKMQRAQDKARGGTLERMTFDELEDRVEDASERIACRVENARKPPDRRIDCSDPVVRAAARGASPAK